MGKNIQSSLAVNGFVLLFLLGIISSADGTSSLDQPSSATPDKGKVLALDQLQAEVLRSNARLQAMRAKWEAIQERPKQAEALPNPMFTYRGMDTTRSGSFPDTDEKRFELEQSFPWPGKRSLKGRISIKDAEAMKSEYDAMMREVIMMVKEAYYDLHAVQKAASITRGEESLLKQIARIAETKYSTGESSQQDVLKAQSEITMINQRLLELEARKTTLKAELNTLMNRKPEAVLGDVMEESTSEFKADLERLLAIAEKQRPEIAGAKVQIERSELERKLMAKEYFPDLKLGAEYRSFGNGSDDMAMFMVGMEIPIWQGKYRAGTREAEKTTESGKAALDAVQKQVAFDVKDAHVRLLTTIQLLDIYRNTLVPQAEMRFKASQAGYSSGKSDFMELLESERFLLNARVMMAMTEGRVGMEFARLERAIGAELKSPQENEVRNAK